MLVGDSITQFAHNPSLQGWAAALQNLYVRKYDVINRGFSGYTSRDMRYIIKDIEIGALNTLFLGANDAAIDSTQTVPLQDFCENMLDILKRFEKVILITPPPVSNQDWANRNMENTRKYRDAVLEIAQSKNIPVVDTWEIFGKDWNECLIDGLHLNSKGNQLLFEGLAECIAKHFPELNQFNGHFKDWKEIDIRNLPASLYQ